jgi:lipoprotein-anchoring transpeptidase ErfK/SrfK
MVLRRGVLPVLAVACVAQLLLAACGGGAGAEWSAGSSPGATGPTGGAASPAATGTPKPSGKPVHVRLFQADGSTYGVGMPIIAYLSASITDGKPFAEATKVTVDGSPVEGAWFFQKSSIYKGYPLEAHYRPREYWPAHADIRMDLPVEGLSAGAGWVFDNSLTLDMSTGAANISKIDGKTERMVVTSDGKQKFTFPVSLGAAKTPTFSGTKIVMEKTKLERMVGEGYDVKVPWSVRVTNSGEFIHSASWNGGNIGRRSTSHGCTNLTVADARKYFDFAQIGDVTVYTNTGGATMPSWDGFGDWNLPWTTWQGGGQVPTT